MALSRADALAAVEKSPAAAGARDRGAWVGLFAADGRVEDPVGSRPHRGSAEIGRFFDTFIGPRDVAYLPDVDIVVGSTVVRDGVLRAALGSVVLEVPIYIRYDVTDTGAEPKIIALSAFWELPAMVGQFLRKGVKGVPAALALSKALLANQGVTGTVGFLRGFRGAGRAGKRQVRAFVDAAAAGDEMAVRRRLGRGVTITSGDDVPMSAAELMTRVAGARPRKQIAAGQTVTVGLDGDRGRLLMLAEVTQKPFAIRRIRVFADSASV